MHRRHFIYPSLNTTVKKLTEKAVDDVLFGKNLTERLCYIWENNNLNYLLCREDMQISFRSFFNDSYILYDFLLPIFLTALMKLL